MEKRVIDYIEEVSEIEINDIRESYSWIESEIESMTPIEQLMYTAFRHILQDRWGWEYYINPQYGIDKYRVDFLISCQFYWEPTNIYKKASCIVECDGHDYHERTKEQASKDKKRDRELQALGYTVFRFTGSDIWKNPTKCAQEVEDFLRKEIHR